MKVSITYDEGSDTYRMAFLTRTGNAKSSFDQVYFDQLHDLIESETGLYTRL